MKAFEFVKTVGLLKVKMFYIVINSNMLSWRQMKNTKFWVATDVPACHFDKGSIVLLSLMSAGHKLESF